MRLIWTKAACDDYRRGRVTKRLMAHTITNLDWPALRTIEDRLRRDVPRIVLDNTADAPLDTWLGGAERPLAVVDR